MTEEEAKTKVCPQTFGIPDVRDHDGNGLVQGGPRNCLGSACMAWRRLSGGSVHRLNPDGSVAYSFPASSLAEFEHRPHYFRTEPAGGGYCGLAGQPS